MRTTTFVYGALALASVNALPAFEKRHPVGEGGSCSPQPSGSGPVTSGTAADWLANPIYDATALAATTPDGYTEVFEGSHGSVDANVFGVANYITYEELTSYDVAYAANACKTKYAADGCIGFNIYYERNPVVDPGTACPNPDSTTRIKVAFWKNTCFTAGTDTNVGQSCFDFKVVIAGSNGYVLNNSCKPATTTTTPAAQTTTTSKPAGTTTSSTTKPASTTSISTMSTTTKPVQVSTTTSKPATTTSASCTPDKELYNGKCVPLCKPGQTRDSYGYCCDKNLPPTTCSPDQEFIGFKCVPKCKDGQQRDIFGLCCDKPSPKPVTCSPDQEWIGFLCVPKCKDGQQRDFFGICCQKPSPTTCSSSQELINGKCLQKCRDDQTRDQFGICCDKPVQKCPDGSIKPANGQCPPQVQKCPDGSVKPANGQCPPTKTCIGLFCIGGWQNWKGN